jgi:hypothetical protein
LILRLVRGFLDRIARTIASAGRAPIHFSADGLGGRFGRGFGGLLDLLVDFTRALAPSSRAFLPLAVRAFGGPLAPVFGRLAAGLIPATLRLFPTRANGP